MFQGRRSRESKEVLTEVVDAPPPKAEDVHDGGTAKQHAVPPAPNSLLRREDMVTATQTSQSKTGGAILGRGCKFEGKLSFDGTVQIDGEFYGDIDSAGHLVVSDGAKIDGTIKVASAVVSGAMTGRVETSGTLELTSTASLVGELVVDSLTIERGAHFQGEVKMTGGSS